MKNTIKKLLRNKSVVGTNVTEWLDGETYYYIVDINKSFSETIKDKIIWTFKKNKPCYDACINCKWAKYCKKELK